MNVEIRREVTNPHDRITIDCANEKAAQLAVMIVGRGAYGIADGVLPVFILGGSDEWCQETYKMSLDALFDSVPIVEIVEALESMRLEGERSSVTDLVGIAKLYADGYRSKSVGGVV